MTNFNINEEIDRIIDNTFGTANLRCLQSKLCDKLELVDKMLETKKKFRCYYLCNNSRINKRSISI